MKLLTCFTPLWKLLLRLYPQAFRERFGAEMLQVLTTAGSQQMQQRGMAGAIMLCLCRLSQKLSRRATRLFGTKCQRTAEAILPWRARFVDRKVCRLRG